VVRGAEKARSADAVFTGTVAGVTVATGGPQGQVMRFVNFDVDTVYKGPVDPSIDVHTGYLGGGDCGVKFVVDERYTVFAEGPDDDLYAGLCNKPIVGDIDPAKFGLGPGTHQTPVTGLHRPLSVWLIVFTVAVGIVAVAAIVLVARRRRRAGGQTGIGA
jgi:hypothetical protein